MHREELNQRLSGITTLWTLMRQAHEGPPDDARSAQGLLFERYRKAVHAYLLAATRDPIAADDLTQEFGVLLVRGSFREVDPERGRFRYFLKVVLSNLVNNHRRKNQRAAAPLPPDDVRLAGLAAVLEDPGRRLDEQFRADLLDRTREQLAAAHSVWHCVLRIREASPDLPSPALALALTEQLGRPYTAVAARQAVHRARELFADLLLEEVAKVLQHPTLEKVVEEVRDLNLLEYARPALERLA
jgi:DNA-directed RNA polymerase specialized sigma24 family protein